MDGPTVPWTMADVSKLGGNKAFLLYHVMGSGCSYMTPLGCALGAAILPTFGTTLGGGKPLTTLQAAGVGGMAGGALGGTLGMMAMIKASHSNNPNMPWTDDGIQMRVDGLSHNYMVRALDLGMWLGAAAAGGALLAYGGPQKLGLSSGTLGGLQAIALGSAVGSVSAMGVISVTK